MESKELRSSNEFFDIPWSDCDMDLCKKGLEKENIRKNRYKNVIALDSTRVKIDGERYINANYIDIGIPEGHPNKFGIGKKIIATQGPMKNTEHDFWTMVLENRSPIILMLTDCVEGNRNKCSDYWPSTKKARKTFFSCDEHGRVPPITVEKVGEDEIEGCRYIVSNLIISCGDKTLDVKHIHYSGWKDSTTPDPDDIRSIISFLEKEWICDNNIICHCSAGIGRTGVLITILKCMKSKEDPALALTAIRGQRHGMVQTKEQYRFILDFTINKL